MLVDIKILNKYMVLCFSLIAMQFSFLALSKEKIIKNKIKGKKIMQQDQKVVNSKKPVVKKILKNGMTILVRPVNKIPKVSIQVFYNVGSKDEKTGEKGIAHLIEHMIFKGTKKLSESDMNIITYMLSGYCNAFTSYDYTGYLFDMPTHHWQETLPIIADCMTNASFKDEHLNSEMKAVIQELKMGKDDFSGSMVEELLGAVFAGHPYSYPIIGYKQDLWSVNGKDLQKFYKKHYCPNNATLVVVGDVNPEEVFALAQKEFGSIKADESYKKEEFFCPQDIMSKSVKLYRDIKQPFATVAFTVASIKEKVGHALDSLLYILANGKSSRLYKKIVEEEQLATSLGGFVWNLFDKGIFFIYFEPKDKNDVAQIESIIQQEIENIINNGLDQAELQTALKKSKMKFFAKLENSQDQAYSIGSKFLATGDENYIFNYLNVSLDVLERDILSVLKNHFRSSVMHSGIVLPLIESEKEKWNELQKESDLLDNKILSQRQRTTEIETPSYAKTITVKEPVEFVFPKYKEFVSSNGIKVLYAENDNTPKATILLSLKARSYYDSTEKPGLYNFMMCMLDEGTINYTAEQFTDELESRGMVLQVVPGAISLNLLAKDLPKGLELLQEMLTNPIFDEKQIEKVRKQILVEIKNFWDSQKSIAGHLVSETVYKNHPYSKNILGTKASIESITKKDLQQCFKTFVSPDKAKLAIVGDIKQFDVQRVLEESFSDWQGEKIADINFPSLQSVKNDCINYFINRDQVLLCFVGLSVDRKHQDYDKLLLFDQLFGGGALGSMSSRLFQLREQSGLFYSIGGSLTARANEQPGLAIVQTLVSLDRLSEAEKVIKKTIDETVDTVSKQELVQAKRAILNSLMNNFESNSKIATSFLFLDKYKLPMNYFDKRAQDLKTITVEQVQKAVRKVLSTDKMVTIKVGRVED